jgi:hypothetical protein
MALSNKRKYPVAEFKALSVLTIGDYRDTWIPLQMAVTPDLCGDGGVANGLAAVEGRWMPIWLD